MPYAFDFAVPGLGLQADLKRIVSGNKTIAEVVAAAKVRYKEAFATVKMEAGRLDEALYGNFDIVLAHFSRSIPPCARRVTRATCHGWL